MKRIIDGVTYNTETATALARSKFEDEREGEEGVQTLYQNRGGAYFLVYVGTKGVWNERECERMSRDEVEFSPFSPEQAHKWMMTGETEILSNPFDDPPEATAEAEPGATIYVRVPISLKRNVDFTAKEAGVSGNVWAMRCIEQCLGGFPKELAEIWCIANFILPWSENEDADAELNKYKLEKATEALTEIADLVKSFAKTRFGTDDLAKIPGFDSDLLSDISRRYPSYPE